MLFRSIKLVASRESARGMERHKFKTTQVEMVEGLHQWRESIEPKRRKLYYLNPVAAKPGQRTPEVAFRYSACRKSDRSHQNTP